jgi:AcrR family transcriptional regulator
MDAETLEGEVNSRHDGGAKRRQIMDGARTAFLSAGFDGASMNDIARSAGVSKGTLYAYFTSKDELFEAIIRAEKAQAVERICAFKREGDVREMLTDFGVRLMSRMTEPGTLALTRVVIAAAEKFPNVGRAFYEAGPHYGATRLAEELGALEKSGALKAPDPERAAWHFLDLCQSYVFKRLLFGVVESLTADEIEGAVKAGVEVFLKAYGV